MSNILNTNPLVIDTAFSTKYSVQVGALTPPPGGFVLDEIYWYQPTTIGHTLTMTLGDGATVIRQAYCEAPNQSQIFKMYGMRLEDFQVTTISSGKMYIYFR